MSKGKQFLDRWKTDYDFKTVTGASGSLAMTVVFALYNGFLGVRHSSLRYGTICVYYIVLTGLLLSAAAIIKGIARAKNRK